MQHDDALLLAALRLAPRRYRMPPLPADVDAARASGAEAALAFAIEAARLAQQHGAPPPAQAKALFTSALARLIRLALQPGSGDPAFQALVLRAQAPEVDEHVRLGAQAQADRRAVRSAVDAIAHPGKLHRMAPGALREALSPLHGLAAMAAWTELRRAIAQLLAQEAARGDARLHAALLALQASPELQRLERGSALLGLNAVQRYQALCERCGPRAGSDAAAAQGRAATRLGADAEAGTVQAFRAMAELLDRRPRAAARHRVVHGLRVPGGFPGAASQAKEEWDVAIVRADEAGGPADIVLLAEVKASPAAATSDFPRLVRGLHRLAQAHAGTVYAFPCAEGELRLHGASLRRLQPPPGPALPPHVVYCCTAAAESPAPLLSPASRALLLAEPASIAFARAALQGGSPRHGDLDAVWEALTDAPRLRATLHQHETARSVREAMLHPQDLLNTLASLQGLSGPDDPP